MFWRSFPGQFDTLNTKVQSSWSCLKPFLRKRGGRRQYSEHSSEDRDQPCPNMIGDRTKRTSPSWLAYQICLEMIVKTFILRSRKTWIFTRATRKSWFPLVFYFLAFLPKRIKFKDCRFWYQRFKCFLVTYESCQSEFRSEICCRFSGERCPL